MTAGPSDPNNLQANPYQSPQQLNPALPSGRLGSLSQTARLKKLNTARGILFAIGILSLIVTGIDMATMRDQVKGLLDQQVREVQSKGMVVDPVKLQNLEDRAVHIGWLMDSGFLTVGALFIVFGFIIKKYPVPITITSLILYLACAAIMAYLNPATLAAGLVIKIIIIVALAKSIQSARAYEEERRIDAIKADVAAGYPR